MIENLKIGIDNVSWQYKNNEIKIEIADVFFASENRDLELIKVNSGKNYIESKVYYYSYDGTLHFLYDLEKKCVEWFFQGNRKYLFEETMKQVGYFPKEQKVLIICGDQSQELKGYTITGEHIFTVKNPTDYKMLYFVINNAQIAVVCDGDEKRADMYGRTRYNFFIDIDTGRLTQGGYAY